MSTYNLIDEPWIPVRMLDGTIIELGIKDTLLRAKEAAGIEDPSPLVVASLYRFLLAVLYRALEGPTDIDQAKVLFRDGLPGDKIVKYLEKWRGRFWLFDEKYPFGQIPSFVPKIWRAWTVLAAEHNADNAKVLFDHVDVEQPGSIREASAVRWLLATQTFSVSCGKSELSHTATAPSATSMIIIPFGNTLLDTLIFSLVKQNREIIINDLAMWEREPETVSFLKTKTMSVDENGKDKEKGPEKIASGLADLYTWRVRSVVLKQNKEGVSTVGLASGIGYKNTTLLDPMVAYRTDEKRGNLPYQYSERGAWRDFDSLLPSDAQISPKVIEHAIELTKRDTARFPQSIFVLGQANDKAKIDFWRMEMLILPRAVLGNRSIRSDIHKFLKLAENTQAALWKASDLFARNLLSRGTRKIEKADVRLFINQLPGTPAYWNMLETRFHELLQSFTIERDSDEIECDWLIALKSTLEHAWNLQKQSVAGGDAWTIRAIVKAEVPIQIKLKELKLKISEFQTNLQKENA